MVPLLEALLLLFPRKFHDAPESAFLERGTVLVGFPAALYADYLAHAGSRLGEGDRHMPRCVLAAPSSRTRRFPVRRGDGTPTEQDVPDRPVGHVSPHAEPELADRCRFHFDSDG